MAESTIDYEGLYSFTESNRSGHFQTPEGLLIQWGTKSVASLTATATTNFTVTFPVAYTVAPHVIMNLYRTTLANSKRFAVLARSVTTTAINGGIYNSGAAVSSASTVGWIAIGVISNE